MKKILLIILCFMLLCLTSCKHNDQTITLGDTPEEVYECVDELIKYIQPDYYVYHYELLQGKPYLDVDFICKISIYYSEKSQNFYQEYYKSYICYIRDDDIDWEEVQ